VNSKKEAGLFTPIVGLLYQPFRNGNIYFVSNEEFRAGGKHMNEPIYQKQPTTHALAILSLVLGILGMTPILPLIGSISAVVTGMVARKEILAKPNEYSGESMARAGLILGWIGVGIALLAVIALLLFLVPVRVLSS
jgi:hypothetical protein